MEEPVLRNQLKPVSTYVSRDLVSFVYRSLPFRTNFGTNFGTTYGRTGVEEPFKTNLDPCFLSTYVNEIGSFACWPSTGPLGICFYIGRLKECKGAICLSPSRLNDHFEKDVEALATSARSKLDVAAVSHDALLCQRSNIMHRYFFYLWVILSSLALGRCRGHNAPPRTSKNNPKGAGLENMHEVLLYLPNECAGLLLCHVSFFLLFILFFHFFHFFWGWMS